MSAMTKRTRGFTKFQGEDSSFRLSAMKGDHLIQLEEPSTIFFVPTCGSLGFTISDFVGRILPFLFPRPLISPTMVLAFALGRITFLPLFLLCNLVPADRHVIPVVFHSDAVFIVLIVAFGVSNGLLCR